MTFRAYMLVAALYRLDSSLTGDSVRRFVSLSIPQDVSEGRRALRGSLLVRRSTPFPRVVWAACYPPGLSQPPFFSHIYCL